jgi:antitoxin ParD1/3/4
MTAKSQGDIRELRQLWQQASADKSPGVVANKVLDRLERKYQAIADAVGATE